MSTDQQKIAAGALTTDELWDFVPAEPAVVDGPVLPGLIVLEHLDELDQYLADLPDDLYATFAAAEGFELLEALRQVVVQYLPTEAPSTVAMLTAQVIRVDGPAAGNPVLRFSGEHAHLVTLMRIVFGPDADLDADVDEIDLDFALDVDYSTENLLDPVWLAVVLNECASDADWPLRFSAVEPDLGVTA